MRVGIFGSDDDLQVHAVAREVRALGFDDVLLRNDALDEGFPLTLVDGRVVYRGVDTSGFAGFYLRNIPAAYAPYLEADDGELVLPGDWHAKYERARQQSAFYVSWLVALKAAGARLVNPPQAASVLQYKPFQLDVLRRVGARVPRTLISNDPDAVRAFHAEVKDVVFKPVMGGALTQRLDEDVLPALHHVTKAPVIFQERIEGDDLRVMLAGDDVVSAVAIRTPEQHLDFRGDPSYRDGESAYEEVQLPDEVVRSCREAARGLGLRFAGIDIKRTRAGEWVFLELNSSPIYLDVELKLGHPISRGLAEVVVGRR
ncbi:MAG: ATP-grasp domain-containing protein [Myxococcales bacterium]|nr:ATP-grasp domain-containing protein [Myxococcales bacterium]